MYSSMAHREGAITALGQCDPGMPFPTLPDPPEISFQTKANPRFFSLQYLGHITGDLHSSGRKKKGDFNIFICGAKGLSFCRDSKAHIYNA